LLLDEAPTAKPRFTARGVCKERTTHADIARHRDALIALCRRYDVARLEVFGSAARGNDFDPARSDADFLVTFKPESRWPPLEQFLGFAEALEALLGRPVDLVEPQGIKNPYILAGINRSREVVYAA
jgi:predicted nucleotidyltransferase